MAEASVLAAAYSGWLLLALRQARHAAAVSGSKLSPRARACAACCGLVLLVASFVCSIVSKGPAFGSLFGVLSWSVAAMSVTLTLAFYPGLARPVAKLLAAI